MRLATLTHRLEGTLAAEAGDTSGNNTYQSPSIPELTAKKQCGFLGHTGRMRTPEPTTEKQ